MSSYPGLAFYITVDNCNYQLIIRASSFRMNLYTRFLITALLSGTWYSTNMVEAKHVIVSHMKIMYTCYCVIPPQLSSIHGRAESSKQSQFHFSGTHVKFPQ